MSNPPEKAAMGKLSAETFVRIMYDEITAHLNLHYDQRMYGWHEVQDAMERATKKMREIALDRQGWIPVGERLPEPHRTLLVTNNLDARDAFGEMSHVFLIDLLQEADEKYDEAPVPSLQGNARILRCSATRPLDSLKEM